MAVRIDISGKGDVDSHYLTIPYYTLEADKKKSVGKVDEDGNLIIQGDNLYALKSLLPRYESKIKCIYIDPPYNTGNKDWVYNDDIVKSQYLREQQGKDIDSENPERHDIWLCMMWPRLRLLHELLAEDGVIFISIDENEQHRLRMIMDEIFGEENFEGNITWRRRHNQPNDKSKMIAVVAEYILVYAKKSSILKQKKSFYTFPLSNERIKNYKNPDGDIRGEWDTTPWKSATHQGGSKYEIITPSGKNLSAEWMGTKETFNQLLDDKRIIFPDNGNGFPRKKIFLSEREKEGQPAYNFWTHQNFGSNQEGSAELSSILGNKVFENPKPTNLIKAIIRLVTKDNDIILDSFAGSGTTAQAVLELNKEDGGNRKFILVECEKEIADKTTAERVRRVIKGVPKAKNETLKAGLGGSFTYCTLGQEINPEKILTGESMPDYETLARHVFWLATGQTLPSKATQRKDWFIGETATMRLYLIYQPDIEFLGSKEAALTFEMGEAMKKSLKGTKQKAYVFAPAAYISHKDLHKLRLSFCQLPWSLRKRIMESL